MLNMSKLKLPKTIKMVITDFDGIITDNCIYISDDGIISRKINFKDVVGFYLLKKNNIDVDVAIVYDYLNVSKYEFEGIKATRMSYLDLRTLITMKK